MERSSTISGRQLLAVLLLSRFFSALAYTPYQEVLSNGSTTIVGIVISYGLSFLITIPVYLFLRAYPGRGLVDGCMMVSPKLGKAVGGILAILFIVFGAHAAAQFQYFISSVFDPKSSSYLFLILLIGVAAYFVFIGLEAFSRAAFIIFFFTILSMVILMLTLMKDIELRQVISPFYYGVGEVFKSGFTTAAHNLEFIALAVMVPYSKGNPRKSIVWMNTWILLWCEIINFLVLTVLGDYAQTQNFPFHAVTSMVQFSFAQRLDVLYINMWTTLALIKVTLNIFLAVHCIKMISTERARNPAIIISSIIVALLGGLYCLKVSLLSMVYEAMVSGWPLFCIIVLLPTILLGWSWLKGRRAKP